MTLRWTFPFDRKLRPVNLGKLADEIMPEFALDKSEYKVVDNTIDGSPNFNFWKSTIPERFSIYDVQASPNSDDTEIRISIRLYKLFVTPLFFPAIFILTGSLVGLLIGLFMYVGTILLYGSLTWFSLLGTKDNIRKKIKTFANKS